MPPRSSNWKSRAQVVRELPPSPQGTTALSTPPFVRAGYDCRNNTTVLRRPEAVGGHPSCDPAPLTTSLRGLWVSGNAGTGQWWNERRGGDPKTDRATQRGGDPKTDQRKEELSKQLGVEGRGPENPGVVAPLTFCKLSRQLLVGLNEHRWRRTKSTASSTSRWVTPPHDAHRSVGLGRSFAPPAHPGQHHHFAPHDEVEEQCVRSRFRTL